MSDKKTLKVLIVDDDEYVRSAIQSVIMEKGGYFTMEAAEGSTAVRTFEAERPNAVILDLRMPDMDGIKTMKEMSKIDPTVPVIMLTAHGDVPTAVEAIKCGAYDFIMKPPNFKKLLNILKQAIESPVRYSSKVPSSEGYRSLSPREREIMRWTVEGHSSTKIAERLSISPRTVEAHRAHIMKKLGLNNKSELIRYAVFHGIFTA